MPMWTTTGPAPSGKGVSGLISLLSTEVHQIAWKCRYNVDPLNAIAGATTMPFGPDINTANDGGNPDPANQRKLDPQVSVGGLGNGALKFTLLPGTGVGNATFDNLCMINGGTAGLPQLPANTNFVILSVNYDTVAQVAEVGIADGNGTQIAFSSIFKNDALISNSNGYVWLGVDEFSSTALHATFDGLGIYVGHPFTSANRYTKPSKFDPGIVVYYPFEDASSGNSQTTAVDAVSGGTNNLTLTNPTHFSWTTGGLWDLVPGNRQPTQARLVGAGARNRSYYY